MASCAKPVNNIDYNKLRFISKTGGFLCKTLALVGETGRPNLSHETKFSGVNGNKENFPCSADHGQDWQAHPVDYLYSVVYDDPTCIHIYCRVYPQLPPVIGASRVCCGHASGIYFPRLL